jgi:hypothetical protein
MTAENSHWATRKQKATRELKELSLLSLYLACFFCSFATYNMLLLHDFQISFFHYSFALINAIVIAKVIVIGQWAHLGEGHEGRPLYLAVLYKAFLFGLLALVFHGIEELIKQLMKGESVASGLREMEITLLLARTLVVFFAFVSLFAYLELRRRLGDSFQALIFGGRMDRKV